VCLEQQDQHLTVPNFIDARTAVVTNSAFLRAARLASRRSGQRGSGVLGATYQHQCSHPGQTWPAGPGLGQRLPKSKPTSAYCPLCRIPRAATVRYGPPVRATPWIAILALAVGTAVAGAPQHRVRETVDAVSAIVNDPQLQGTSNERERRERVARIMRKSFDFRAMSQESLGTHWASLAPEQRNRFVDL